jgi:hypothetical protein
VSVTRVGDPSDLTRLGITVSRLLAESDGEEPPVACVHSLTELLQYVDRRRLFRFLHLLKNRIDSVEANAHYHMDPSAHDPQVVSVFESLFDVVVRVEENGDLALVSADGDGDAGAEPFA